MFNLKYQIEKKIFGSVSVKLIKRNSLYSSIESFQKLTTNMMECHQSENDAATDLSFVHT